jgi:hypothetical protein
MQQDSRNSYSFQQQDLGQGPQTELKEQQLRLYRNSPYYRLIHRNKERVLGELASLRNSPIFQYLSEIRAEFNRILILKPQSVDMDIIRGKIQIIDEILNMSEAIKNSERLERDFHADLERLDKELQ